MNDQQAKQVAETATKLTEDLVVGGLTVGIRISTIIGAKDPMHAKEILRAYVSMVDFVQENGEDDQQTDSLLVCGKGVAMLYLAYIAGMDELNSRLAAMK